MLTNAASSTFIGTYIDRGLDGSLNVFRDNSPLCPVYYSVDARTVEETIAQGYILLPYLYQGEYVFVKSDQSLLTPPPGSSEGVSPSYPPRLTCH
jgi:hypothetical protein